MTEMNEEEVEDSTEEENDEVSYEQAMEWKRKAESLEKAEKTIVDLKKKIKSPVKIDWEFVSKSEMELTVHLMQNPELQEYKEEIQAYLKKGNTLKEATTLVKMSDKALENKEKAEAMNISGWDGWNEKTTYSIAELEAMPQDKYNKVMARYDKWEISLK